MQSKLIVSHHFRRLNSPDKTRSVRYVPYESITVSSADSLKSSYKHFDTVDETSNFQNLDSSSIDNVHFPVNPDNNLSVVESDYMRPIMRDPSSCSSYESSTDNDIELQQPRQQPETNVEKLAKWVTSAKLTRENTRSLLEFLRESYDPSLPTRTEEPYAKQTKILEMILFQWVKTNTFILASKNVWIILCRHIS